METKVCSKCGRELPKSEFYRNANTKDGLQSCCKACSNKMATESHRRKANKVKEQLNKLEAMEAKQKPVEQPKHKVYTNPVLAPITPRELMLELKARGFQVGYKEGAKWADKTMIEKACEWLYVYYPTLERSKSAEDAWDKFKKAMEE